MATPKEQFLQAYDREHEVTLRVLRAYPEDQLELRPHPKAKTARELAWVFVLECGLGKKVWNDEFAKAPPASGATPPKPPETWDEQMAALEQGYKDFRDIVAGASEAELAENVHFFTGPKKMGELSRFDWIRFLLNDQIHHRGQFSVYLRMAGGKVPSIYGPSGDEPWV